MTKTQIENRINEIWNKKRENPGSMYFTNVSNITPILEQYDFDWDQANIYLTDDRDQDLWDRYLMPIMLRATVKTFSRI